MRFSRQEYWSGLPFPSPGDLPDSGIESRSLALQADALTSEPPGKQLLIGIAKAKAKAKSLSHVRLFATPWTVAYQAPPSMGLLLHQSTVNSKNIKSDLSVIFSISYNLTIELCLVSWFICPRVRTLVLNQCIYLLLMQLNPPLYFARDPAWSGGTCFLELCLLSS